MTSSADLVDGTRDAAETSHIGQPITLLDKTVDPGDETSRQGSTPSTTSAILSREPSLRHRLTHQSSNFQESLRREINRQKYARYGQGRYNVNDDEQTQPPSNSDNKDVKPADGDSGALQKKYLERAQNRAKALVKRKNNIGTGVQEKDTVVDVLYENQRGAFLFGIPKYSSSSLLPTDPKPWQNADFRTSPVDIRNAQVPDPSWEWTWKSWYVDMSRDVDEEGWEYSFAFVGHGGRTFAWHGTHPWFHSFVRRRRWLRVRKRSALPSVGRDKAHDLNPDYFTIHTKNLRSPSITDSRAASSNAVNVLAKLTVLEMTVENMDIDNIADLFLALRRSSLDREKIYAIRKFLDQANDDLVYLAERMDEIMGMFIFQASRRQVLDFLVATHDELHEKKKDLASHDHKDGDDDETRRHDSRVRHNENILKAVHAARDHIHKLEYWSDKHDASNTSNGDGKSAQHGDCGSKGKQSLKNTESTKPDSSDSHHATNKTRVHDPSTISKDPLPTPSDTESTTPGRNRLAFFDAKSKVSLSGPLDQETPTDEVYVTAAESASEIDGKGDRWQMTGKANPADLDGVPEEAAEEQQPVPDVHGHSSIVEGDELQELVPESEIDD
ncbi:uncharacterized protein K489DRAFT_157632 [Dissoconium aciculare CBS 342.82]|uniref:Peroxin/Ferlin domain-containing protein n=1 Tax=Dissoconium aciculare CBS 342.82 TaxID=1314786 RepID=A0A6J3MCX7_9PEZI|nr:uncharacterized protein K489DRAFT_157632 [Dissoconium aciculare CBS 342.82]KAF1825444.1 hypothetical protein K489DRAFT_157632 [Dissoconium aciculare CBS 342.82]